MMNAFAAIGLIAGVGGLVTLLVIAGIITLIITVLQRHRKAKKGIHNIGKVEF